MLNIQFWQLVSTAARLKLKSEASNSYLNYLWWLLEPALFILVFYIVFDVFLSRGTEDFVIFLICGQIPYQWFARSVANSSNAIFDNRGLMNQVALPKSFFPFVVLFQDSVKSLAVFLLMFIIVVSSGYEIGYSWLSLPIIMFVQFLFICAISFICCGLVPFIPDLKYIINTGLMMLMFASGVFYNYSEALLPEHQGLFLLNPMASFIDMYRGVLMLNSAPNWLSLMIIALVSLLVMVGALHVYKRLDGVYPKLVLE
jgi:lipopolysaccharide transport system permease protein